MDKGHKRLKIAEVEKMAANESLRKEVRYFLIQFLDNRTELEE